MSDEFYQMVKGVSDSAVKPLCKLIDAVRGGAGLWYEPIHVRRMAKAEGDALILRAETKVALTELGTSSRSEKIKGGYKAQSAINITGLAPHDEIGTLSFDPDRFSLFEFLNIFSPSPSDIPDILSPKLTPGPSVVHTRIFCEEENDCATNEDVQAIKKAIDLQDIKIDALSKAEIELAAIQTIQVAINQNANDVEKYLTFLKQQFPNNDFIKSATKDNHGAKLADATKALAGEIKKIGDELDKIKDSVVKPGIIITNWKLDKNFSTEAAVAGASGSYSSKKDLQGYLILGNPSVHTLHIGNDMAKLKPCYQNGTAIFRNKNLYATFYQVRAQQVLYAESLQSIISLQAGLKLDELIKTLTIAFAGGVNVEGLKNLKLTLDAQYTRFSLSSNQGFLDATKGNSSNKTFLDITTPCEINKSCCVKANLTSCESRENKSVPVISSRISLDNYLD